jgi:RNA polymerase sigma-70 factor (ECF subfamily)
MPEPMIATATRAELDVNAIVEATGAALEPHLEALHAASFGWAVACCRGRREEAEETLQVAYLKVLNGQARFDGRSAIRTWFFAVIRRTAAERRRAGWIRRLAFARWQLGRVESQSIDPESAASRSQAADRVRTALARLARRQREILHLVFYEGLSVEESARVMDVSVGTARTHFARGKERLRELLGGSSR